MRARLEATYINQLDSRITTLENTKNESEERSAAQYIMGL